MGDFGIYWNLYNNPTLKTICSKDGEELVNIIKYELACLKDKLSYLNSDNKRMLDKNHITEYLYSDKKDLNNNILIEIEGPIGTGKTTLVEKIKSLFNEEFERGDIEIFSETAMDHPNELVEFYSDMKKNAFNFEMLNINHYKKQLDKISLFNTNHKPKIYIMDRGLLSIYTFSMLLYKDKILSYDSIVKLFLEFVKYKQFEKTKYILYIDNDTKVLHERIAKRGRECEKGITKKYLQDYINLSYGIGLIKDSDDVERIKRRCEY